MNRFNKILRNPGILLTVILSRYCHWMGDETYLRILYFLQTGNLLRLNPPHTFNEKLQWLKLHDRSPQYTQMVDKVAAKEYVAHLIGEEYIIPTLGVWKKFDDIDFEKLPEQFVLKCNHDSGGIVVCRGKETLDQSMAKRQLEKSLKRNYFWGGREFCYKNIEPRIIVEQFIENEKQELPDFKFMCFNGKVLCSFVCTERFSDKELKVTFFDRDWNKLPFMRKYSNSNKIIPRPHNYYKMVELAERLAENIGNPFVRIDFYDTGKHIYFGEITFYPGNGMEKFTPKEWDEKLGGLIELPSISHS